MAEALKILAVQQDEDIQKQSAYSSEAGEDELQIDSLTRDKSWFFRLIDFQFAPHPLCIGVSALYCQTKDMGC